MNEFIFNESQTYKFSFKGKTLKLFREGIGTYTDWIKRWQKPGNTKITEILDQNERLAKWLEKKIDEEESDWKIIDCWDISGKTIQICKSTLPYLLQIELDKKNRLSVENPPYEAYEVINDKIKLINEVMSIDVLTKIPNIPLMGKLPHSEQSTDNKSEKIKKELKSKDYWVQSNINGKDEHLFIGRRDGKGEKVHLILDRETGEIRIDRKDLPPNELLEEVYTIAKIKNGPTIKKTKTTLEFINEDNENGEIGLVK